MPRGYRPSDRESGFTLLETLIGLAIISAMFIAMYAALAETVQSTGVQRRGASGETYVRLVSEAIQQQNTFASSYVQCPGYSDIAPATWPTPPTNFTAPTATNGEVTIQYGIPAAWTSSNPSSDFSQIQWVDQPTCNTFYTQFCAGQTTSTCLQGLQLVTVKLPSTDTDFRQWTGTTQIVLRRGNS